MSANRWRRVAVGSGLLLAAFVLHAVASEETRRGIMPPFHGDIPGREDEFLGEDPREFALRPENQALLTGARRVEGLALVVTGSGVLVLLSSLLTRGQGASRDVATPCGAGASHDGPEDSFTRLAEPTAGRPAARP